MVLQSNFAKRVDAENTPPNLNATKAIGSRPRTSLHDAARRRRARTNGGARTPKYVVEQARRRSGTKSPVGVIGFNMVAIPTTPPSVADVEMKDVEPAPSTSAPAKTIPVLLPKELGRPEYCDPSKAAIEAVDAELANIEINYIRESLEDFGPEMFQALRGVKFKGDIAKDSMPKEIAIIVQDLATTLPTHAVAVYARNGLTKGTRTKVTLYPIHSIIFAAHCARLPPFPSATPPPPPPPPSLQGSQEVTIPVLPLGLPSPQTYLHLSSFLYLKRTDILLRSLLPCAPPVTLAQDSSHLPAFATKLASTHTIQALSHHCMIVHGLWQNVCALGIFDDSLWDTIDLAWRTLLTSIAISTGNPRAMITSPSSLSQPSAIQPVNQSS